MILRLLGILGIEKHWNWYFRVTGGLKCPNMSVNISAPITSTYKLSLFANYHLES